MLEAGQFRSGAGVKQATTVDQRCLYNTTKGILSLDADGLDGEAAMRFAGLVNRAAIPFGEILGTG